VEIRENSKINIAIALLLPFMTCWMQWHFWLVFRPFVWFLFFPTVFFSSRIGGKAAGIVSTIVSASLVVYVFMAPQLSLIGKSPANLLSVVVFLIMGVLFSFTHDRLEKANRLALESQEAARVADEQLREARISLLLAEKKLAEDEVAVNRRKLEAALASMTDAVFISDALGRFIEFNDAFATFHKFRSKEECARTFAEYPDILDVYLPNGELAAVEQWAVPRALRGETATNAEYSLRRKDTGETWVGSYSFAPIRDKGGEIVGSVVAGRDITASKRAEEEIHRLNAGLEQRVEERTAELVAANMELDAFAYAVSHDLRAPLRAMNGFSQALVEDFGEQLHGEALVYLEQIITASRHMGQLIDGLLTLSRSTRGEFHRDRLDLSQVAEAIRQELVRAEPGRVVEWRIEPDIQVSGDAVMLEAVMHNLIGNSWKYTAGTQTPQISVYSEERHGTRCCCVADNGAGFDMKHAGQLFKPFQRLHRQDEFPGIGIGLATVQRIVHRHGGEIGAEAEPGKGAVFRFTLG
jgi:PAS domain S-box-containing protein